MRYVPQKHRRRSIRLKGYDYSQPGGYYVTLVTQNRECLFGDVVDGKMVLNEAGRIVEWIWYDLPNHVANVKLDEFVVMPNHVHGIIMIMANDHVGAIHELPLHELPQHELPQRESPQHESPLQRRNMTLPKIIGRFK
ncbi:MAG: hypothetical protein WHT29_04170 [Bacteroidales bacterium]